MQQPTGAEMKQFEDIWCSGCSRKGHLEQNCYNYKRSHPPASVFIYSFLSAYSASVDPDPPCKLNETMEKMRGRKLRLGLFNCKFFMEEEGSTFLEILQVKTGVTVRIIKAGPYVKLLFPRGEYKAHLQAVAAIRRFLHTKNKRHTRLEFVNRQEATIQDLQTNLDLINDSEANWYGLAQKIYRAIKKYTSAISGSSGEGTYLNQQNQLKALYRALNTIIIAKLQFGVDRTHMNTLAKGLSKRQIPLPSFEYVFNSGRILYPNYGELIAQLPTGTDFEGMKNKVVAFCRERGLDDWLKKVLYDYSCLIISDYSKEYVTSFTVTCSACSTKEPAQGKFV